MQRTIPKNSFKSFNLAPLVREYEKRVYKFYLKIQPRGKKFRRKQGKFIKF